MAEALHQDPLHQRRTVVEIVDAEIVRSHRTLTPLGSQLLEARRKIEQAGIPLLTREQLERERADRAGGVPNHR